MRPVTDPDFDAKAFVAAGYDRCAKKMAFAKDREPPEWLIRLTKGLQDGAKILDVGCGCGIPIAATLSQRFRLTGVDISQEQIKLAQKLVPGGTFLYGDATKMTFDEGAFDAAVMLYTLFHIPREEQAAFFKKLRSWLVDGGLVFLSLSERSEAGYTEDDFFGAAMYWSNYSKDQSIDVLQEAGFSVIWEGVIGHTYADQSLKIERHPLVLLEAV